MIITIIIFIVILGILVLVHEFGHFIVAKKSGMKVSEFGFGFPPRAIGIQKSGGKFRLVWSKNAGVDPDATVYSINWIPFGGFVKIVGENNEDHDNPQSFINKPFFPRLLTLLAGVIMNVILAWALISIGYMAGLPVAVGDGASLPDGAVIKERGIAIIAVEPGSRAEEAGLKPNDTIVRIDDRTFSDIQGIQTYIQEHVGQTVEFGVKRGQSEVTAHVTPNPAPPEGQGPTGIALSRIGLLSFPWYKALYEGALTTWHQTAAIGSGLYHLVVAGQGLESVGGPVKIAKLTGEVADMGFIYLIQFTAFLSLNLAVLNSLPFPALDGGRVLFLLIEKIRGKRNNQHMEQIANTIGFLLLLLLMVIVTVNDIR